jgi:peptide/nickel transport system substrate-binding protein
MRASRAPAVRRALALIGVLAISISAMSASSAAAPSRILIVAVPLDPGHIDPPGGPVGADLAPHVYRKLYAFTPAMVPEPDLVAAERVSADLRTWTLELRRGVTFSDGTPVDAAAVKHSLDRLLDLRRHPVTANLFRPIRDVRVVSTHVVEIETSQPYASLKHNLAYHSAGIVSPRADRVLGPRFGRAPVSAGPYVISEWVSGDRIVLTRFEAYQGRRPYYDQIVFRVVPAPETRLAMVERDEAQVAIRMPPTMVGVVAGQPNLRVIRVQDTALYYLWLNLDRPPTSDLRVRRALNLAVDRSAIMARVALGVARPATTVMERSIRHSCPVGTLAYDPGEARRLLAEAGATGQRLRLLAGDGILEMDRQVAEAVAGYLREAGVETDLQLVADAAAFYEVMAKRDAHLGLFSWSGATADPDQYLKRQLWGRIAGQRYNLAGYRNPRVDALIEEGARTFDDAQRARIYCEAQRLVWHDWPWLILFRLDGATVARAGITGIQVFANSQANVFTEARPVEQ